MTRIEIVTQLMAAKLISGAYSADWKFTVKEAGDLADLIIKNDEDHRGKPYQPVYVPTPDPYMGPDLDDEDIPF